MSSHTKPPPPRLTARWVRYVLAFGVSVVVGLLPYLGKASIPGFTALLSLVPDALHGVAFPISAAIMGILAVWIQWTGGSRPSQTWLRKRFSMTLYQALLGMALLVVAETFLVVRLRVNAENRTAVYMRGWERLQTAPCPPLMSDAECTKRVVPDEEGKLALVWGETQLNLVTLMILGPYFMVTSSFGLLVGLLVLREETQKRADARRRGRANRSKPVRASAADVAKPSRQ
jgi:hypothetical protein